MDCKVAGDLIVNYDDTVSELPTTSEDLWLWRRLRSAGEHKSRLTCKMYFHRAQSIFRRKSRCLLDYNLSSQLGIRFIRHYCWCIRASQWSRTPKNVMAIHEVYMVNCLFLWVNVDRHWRYDFTFPYGNDFFHVNTAFYILLRLRTYYNCNILQTPAWVCMLRFE